MRTCARPPYAACRGEGADECENDDESRECAGYWRDAQDGASTSDSSEDELHDYAESSHPYEQAVQRREPARASAGAPGVSPRREDDTRYAAVREVRPIPPTTRPAPKTERLDRVDLRDSVDAAPLTRRRRRRATASRRCTRAATTMPGGSARSSACTLR